MDEKTIRKLKFNKDKICEKAQKVDQATQEYTFCASHATFSELKQRLLEWIEAGCRMSLALTSNTICHKAKIIDSGLEN